MLISDAIQGYKIAGSINGLSPNTVELYMYQLQHMLKYLGDVEISELDEKSVLNFVNYMRTEYKTGQDELLSPSSIRVLILAIRSFFTWAEQVTDIDRPDRMIKPPRYKSPDTKALKTEEIEAILDVCDFQTRVNKKNGKRYRSKRSTAKRDKALIVILLDTGIRVSELCRLNISDIGIESGRIDILPYSTGQKTKGRTVYLGNRAHSIVWIYITSRMPYHSEHPLFLSSRRKRLTRDATRHLVVRLGKRADVENLYPHRFRHTFATEYLKNGGDIFTLKRLLGHSSLEMVQHYLTLLDEDVENAHRSASPVDRLLP